MAAILDRIKNEPVVFWTSVATVVIGVYHIVNPAGDKDTLITDVFTTFGPIIVGVFLRSKVSPAGEG